MHEYPITVQIIKIAEKHAQSASAQRVTAIDLVVGEYSGFIGDSIQMYFDIIAEGTMCEGAVIRIERVKPQLKCTGCDKMFERSANFSFACPHCGAEGEPTEVGKEFYIKEIEVI